MAYARVSAKTGEGVSEAFEAMASEIWKVNSETESCQQDDTL